MPNRVAESAEDTRLNEDLRYLVFVCMLLSPVGIAVMLAILALLLIGIPYATIKALPATVEFWQQTMKFAIGAWNNHRGTIVVFAASVVWSLLLALGMFNLGKRSTKGDVAKDHTVRHGEDESATVDSSSTTQILEARIKEQGRDLRKLLREMVITKARLACLKAESASAPADDGSGEQIVPGQRSGSN
ncbi:hypothetical protein OQA88_4655 [Cercophora sp. LCS_1]